MLPSGDIKALAICNKGSVFYPFFFDVKVIERKIVLSNLKNIVADLPAS
jgi:hypothetical protein